MPWFKVDDTLASHPKARIAGLAAMGLWTVAGAWSSQHLTEGFVPDWYVKSWPNGSKRAADLVKSGLWHDAENGWVFHQWDERQPSKEQVEAERAATRERQKRFRESRRNAPVSNGVDNGVTNETPSRPDPTVVPNGTTEKPRKRATQLPADWAPKEDHLAIAVEYGLNPAFELRKFRDHHEAKGSTMKSWDAAFRTWLNNAKTYARPGTRPATTGSQVDWDAAMARAQAREAPVQQVPYDVREIG